MKIRTTPTVPRKARTSDKLLQGPHFLIAATRDSSGILPSKVHRCPKTKISVTQRNNFGPEKVPPQYFICCTIRFKLWKCSQTKWQMPGFSAIVSYEPSASM